MASKQTKNYNLNQWDAGDAVLREDFNADNAKIDAALNAVSFANCKFVTGSYTGTGTYGSGNPCKLQFDYTPQIIFLDVRNGHTYNSIPVHYILFRNMNAFSTPGYVGLGNALTWSGNSVSWYTASSAAAQFNSDGVTYHYMAICTVE